VCCCKLKLPSAFCISRHARCVYIPQLLFSEEPGSSAADAAAAATSAATAATSTNGAQQRQPAAAAAAQHQLLCVRPDEYADVLSALQRAAAVVPRSCQPSRDGHLRVSYLFT
jgi:hypothetical protein